MTTFERCNYIRRIIVNTTAEIINYSSWGAEYSYKRLSDLTGIIKGKDNFELIDPWDLTLDEMLTLGFCKWSSDEPLMLIPLWMLQFINPEANVHCIDDTVVKFKDADNDNRNGCLAYGVYPK